MTEKMAKEIAALRAQGLSLTAIAERVGSSANTVRRQLLKAGKGEKQTFFKPSVLRGASVPPALARRRQVLQAWLKAAELDRIPAED